MSKGKEKEKKLEMTKDKDILHKASNGEMCPYCFSESVIHVGSAPDFINMNNQYDCKKCGAGWEGY